jgi:hypothetical protein
MSHKEGLDTQQSGWQPLQQLLLLLLLLLLSDTHITQRKA